MAFRSSATAFQNTGGTGSLTATPVGVQAGDYLGALYTQDNQPNTLSPPAGWTIQADLSISSPDSQTSYYVDKIATGSDSFNFFTGMSPAAVLIVGAWSGRDTTNPRTFLQVTTSTVANTSPFTMGAAGGTASGGDDLAVFSHLDITAANDMWTWGTISGFTQRESPTSNWALSNLQTKDAVSAGATGSFSSTLTQTAGTTGAGWAAAVVAIKSVAMLPTITAQPTQQSAPVGSTATFSVSATASSGSLSYQWYRADPASAGSNVPGSWSAISGATGSSYTTGALATSDDGDFFYCVVTDSNGSVSTAVARLFLSGQGSNGLGTAGGSIGLTGWLSQRRSRGLLSDTLLHIRVSGDALEDAWSNWAGISVSPLVTTITISSTPVSATWAGAASPATWALDSLAVSTSWAGVGVGTTQPVAASVGAAAAAGVTSGVIPLLSLGTAAAGWSGSAGVIPALSTSVGTATASGTTCAIVPAPSATVAGVSWSGSFSTSQTLDTGIGAASAAGVQVSFTQPVSSGVGQALASGTDAVIGARLDVGVGAAAAQGTAATLQMTLALGVGTAAWLGTSAASGQDVNTAAAALGWTGLISSTLQFLSTIPAAATASGRSVGTVQPVGVAVAAATWSGIAADTPAQLTLGLGQSDWVAGSAPMLHVLDTQASTWTWAPVHLSDTDAIPAQPVSAAWSGVEFSLSCLINAVPAVALFSGVYAIVGRSVREAGLWVEPRRRTTYVLEVEADVSPLYVLNHQPRVWIA